jgi:hypothetical protein
VRAVCSIILQLTVGVDGRTAGRHIAGKTGDDATFQKGASPASDSIASDAPAAPFFWTAQQGKQIRYAGHSEDFDDIVYQGSVDELSFAAFFVKKEKCEAVLTIAKDPVAAKALELLRLGKMPSASELREGKNVLDIAT